MHSNKNCRGSQGFFESTCAIIRDAALPFFVSAFVVCAFPLWSSAQEIAPEVRPALDQCASIASLDGRLLMEQWAPAGECDRPIRTRVTDRFLGFICVENVAERTVCRSFAPPPGSDKFDTSRFFRCVDIAVTETDAGPTVIRMREWVAAPKECDWNRTVNVPSMEVDFTRAEVCAGGLCIGVDRLSGIGKVRLRHLIAKTFQEFGIGTASVARAPWPLHQ